MFSKVDICAGIVLYNPEIERLKDNLNSITKQCNKVILIDNNSNNIVQIIDLLNGFKNVELVKFQDNYGIANALNKLIEISKSEEYQWLLTLDQDSVCKKELIKEYLNFLNNKENCIKSIGCITCEIEDRNFDTSKDKCSEIKYCITSGALMNILAVHDVGGYDNKMFIDKVDLDICIALRKKGYKIFKIQYEGLLHEIGHARQINLLFRKWEVYNHPAIRRYYMCRNASYLLKKYVSVYTLKFFLKEIFQTLLVLIFEDNKQEKIVKSCKGFIEGFKM